MRPKRPGRGGAHAQKGQGARARKRLAQNDRAQPMHGPRIIAHAHLQVVLATALNDGRVRNVAVLRLQLDLDLQVGKVGCTQAQVSRAQVEYEH